MVTNICYIKSNLGLLLAAFLLSSASMNAMNNGQNRVPRAPTGSRHSNNNNQEQTGRRRVNGGQIRRLLPDGSFKKSTMNLEVVLNMRIFEERTNVQGTPQLHDLLRGVVRDNVSLALTSDVDISTKICTAGREGHLTTFEALLPHSPTLDITTQNGLPIEALICHDIGVIDQQALGVGNVTTGTSEIRRHMLKALDHARQRRTHERSHGVSPEEVEQSDNGQDAL